VRRLPGTDGILSWKVTGFHSPLQNEALSGNDAANHSPGPPPIFSRANTTEKTFANTLVG